MRSSAEIHGSEKLYVQIPFIIAHTIRNKTYQMGPGKNIGSEVHVEGLAQLCVKLLEIYLGGGQVPSGYLFPENGEHVMGARAS
jgi:hypothetical protein